MAAVLRRLRGKGDGAGAGQGDDDEEDNRKRLSTVDEGDEAAELAKLAAAEAAVAHLEGEIEAVQAQLAEVEAELAAWEQDPDAAFAALPPGKQRRYKTADGYLAFLEEERKRLSAKDDALRNQLGGKDSSVGGQRHIVAEVKAKKARVERFLVTGRLKGSKRVKGVRRYVYSAVANNAGCAVVATDGDMATAHRGAIYYEEQDLVFSIVFTAHRDAALFCNDVVPTGLGFSADNVVVSSPMVVDVTTIQNIRAWDYRSDDEPGSHRCGDSESTVYTAAEPDGDLAKFQSIELPRNIRKGTVDSAHLVHKTAVEVQGVEDNDNNRLALSPSLHRMFDGRRNQHGYGHNRFPQVMIEPARAPPNGDDGATATMTDSDGEARERAWVKVTGFEVIDCETISFYMKEGTQSVKLVDGFIDYYTFVYVKDVEQFYSNLEWKAAETKSIWDDARNRR